MLQENLIRQTFIIAKNDRQKLNGHASLTVWLTGLSGSGKSTLAGITEKKLFQSGVHTYILDGDNIRTGLNNNVDFSEEGRRENIRRIGETAKLFVDAGMVVLTAFISPFRKDRDAVRALLPENEFIEVYINCPLEICENRDVKGLYKKARAGEIPDFTGISSPFEPPLNPEIEIKTHETDAESGAGIIANYILKRIK